MLPLATSNNLALSVFDTLFEKTGRVDILNSGNKANTLQLVGEGNSDVTISTPAHGRGNVISLSRAHRWKQFSFELKAVGAGTVTIYLMGTDHRVKGKRYPVLADFKDLKINGKDFPVEKRTVWHNDRSTVKVNVSDGDILKISFSTRNHHFKFNDLKKYYNVNGYLVFSLFVLSFLLIYLIVNWAYASSGKKQTINAIFVILFFALLALPASNINQDEKSATENRMLAPKTDLVKNDTLNLKFGGEFERWFNDRFNFRELFIEIYYSLISGVNNYPSVGGVIFDKKTQRMFNLRGNRKSPETDKQAEDVALAVKSFGDYLNQKNIKFYTLIVPSEMDIYKDEFSVYMTKNFIFGEKIFSRIKEISPYPVVFPFAELDEAKKKDFVFFKSDHHWTDWGAYVGYNEIMKEIAKDFPAIHIASLSDYSLSSSNMVRSEWERNYHIGNMARALKFQNKPRSEYLSSSYNYYNPLNKLTHKVERDDKFIFKVWDNPNIKELRGMQCGTSMNENFSQFFPQSFSKTKHIRLNHHEQKIPQEEKWQVKRHYGQYIDEFKPDVFVLCVTAWNLPSLVNLMKE